MQIQHFTTESRETQDSAILPQHRLLVKNPVLIHFSRAIFLTKRLCTFLLNLSNLRFQLKLWGSLAALGCCEASSLSVQLSELRKGLRWYRHGG